MNPSTAMLWRLAWIHFRLGLLALWDENVALEAFDRMMRPEDLEESTDA